ncbi:extracellular solute-binding protein [Cohnella thailandensis]|uniref:Extracellular solute-binding protein n=1 Tax=Cohnella thailandensis TaxID=557557 RepID=A0A841SXT6_9BACL|nr:extracellular solute-binding protein [Cohnella thailandensis]MBB6635015.1 extracellular solute-binding protein [Cohnella thailandensis]MBP1975761.1 putative aldouronate transport system substrate-binding protein [Cohnella thailandensis]
MAAKKTGLTLLLLVWLAALLAGCAGSKGTTEGEAPQAAPTGSKAEAAASGEAAKPDTSKPVTLKMVLISDGAPDAKLVYDEINKKLQQDINATVDVEFIPFADWQKTYSLKFAAGEDFDLIVTATWGQFADYARKGAFMELTPEMMKTYAPLTLESSGQEVLDAGTVDGKLYALPMNYREISVYGYVVRGDLMDKYGISSIDSLDDFEGYLKAVSENDKDLVPWEATSYDNWIIPHMQLQDLRERYEMGTVGVSVDLATNQIVDATQSDPAALELYKRMQSWNQKGYISKNSLVNKVSSKDSFVNGKSSAFLTNLLDANAAYQTVKTAHPEWDVRFYPINTSNKVVANSYMANGMAINAKSKNAERALMLLDLFKNDAWYNQTTTYGIQGKHWDVSADNKLILLADSPNYPPDGTCPWGWRDERYYLTSQDGLPNFDDVMKSQRDRVYGTPLNDFQPDLEKIKTQQAALSDVASQYQSPLTLGFVKDVDKAYEELLVKRKQAGFDTLLQELQAQIDKYVAG